MTPGPLLAVRGLHVSAGPSTGSSGGPPVVEGLDLDIGAGEIVALVGESGCGKSMTAMAVMRLLPAGMAVTAGSIRLDGEELLAKTPAEMDRVRGGRIGMLFQQPHRMLDPTSRVGTQVGEPLRLHRGLPGRTARARAVSLLRAVGIPDPALRARRYAHELSGGMAQRAMIAAALAAEPALLIADEPTTALDATVQVQILRLLARERRRRGLAILLITHDLAVVSALADRAVVMYAGRAVEHGTARAILRAPRHPYTQALVRCSLLRTDASGHLVPIPGTAAPARHLARGCRFHPRCPAAAALNSAACRDTEPGLRPTGAGGHARCWAVGAAPAEAVP